MPDHGPDVAHETLSASRASEGPPRSWREVAVDLARVAAALGQLEEDSATARLAQIEDKLDRLAALVAAGPRPAGAADDRSLRALVAQIDAKLDTLAATSPVDPEATALMTAAVPRATPESADRPWGPVLLGNELWSNPELGRDCARLLGGLLEGDPAAETLVAFVLLYRSATPERLPHLIKDLGEAYYRWQPKVTDTPAPFETALSQWAMRRGEAAGVRNRIDFVRPGSRFNPQQHKASERGVEITEAFGWVVLRDDGSVFQKASVGVR